MSGRKPREAGVRNTEAQRHKEEPQQAFSLRLLFVPLCLCASVFLTPASTPLFFHESQQRLIKHLGRFEVGDVS
jgi:hypothetical protein